MDVILGNILLISCCDTTLCGKTKKVLQKTSIIMRIWKIFPFTAN